MAAPRSCRPVSSIWQKSRTCVRDPYQRSSSAAVVWALLLLRPSPLTRLASAENRAALPGSGIFGRALGSAPTPHLGAIVAELLEWHTRHFDVDVDAIEQRSGEPLLVTADQCRPTGAFVLRIARIPARTGIHRSDKHEAGREREAALGAADGGRSSSSSGWRRDFEPVLAELRQLIEEKARRDAPG